MTLCPVCHGRGEVAAGVTYGNGHVATHVKTNPHAIGLYREVWYLDTNPNVELWGIAVCGTCHGTGFERERRNPS